MFHLVSKVGTSGLDVWFRESRLYQNTALRRRMSSEGTITGGVIHQASAIQESDRMITLEGTVNVTTKDLMQDIYESSETSMWFSDGVSQWTVIVKAFTANPLGADMWGYRLMLTVTEKNF